MFQILLYPVGAQVMHSGNQDNAEIINAQESPLAG
jgi:hypothetical protein